MTTKRWILAAAVLGSGIVFLDSTVVNVALPRIGRDLPRFFLGVLEGQSYVYNAYLLTLSALLILAGAVNDFYGRKRTFLLGLLGFGMTSVLCGFAPNMELLVLFRVLQGATGALLVPGSLALITANFSGEDQGRAFGTWAGASGATTILGPLIGGLITGAGDAYRYLPTSIQKFPDAPDLAGQMRDAGFDEVSFEYLTGGAVALHLGRVRP